MQDNQHDEERDTSLDPYRPASSGVFFRDGDGIEAKLAASVIYDPCVDCTYISVEAVSGTWFTPVVVPWDRDKLSGERSAVERDERGRFKALREALVAEASYTDALGFVDELEELCRQYRDTDTDQQRLGFVDELEELCRQYRDTDTNQQRLDIVEGMLYDLIRQRLGGRNTGSVVGRPFEDVYGESLAEASLSTAVEPERFTVESNSEILVDDDGVPWVLRNGEYVQLVPKNDD